MTRVSVRDFTIFQLKLLIDGLKDGAVFTVSIVAFAVDLVFRRHGRRRIFYKVMRVSERFDLWLNLHGATEGAESDTDGLFGQSEAGSDTMLGQLEQIVRGADEPAPPNGEMAASAYSEWSSARLTQIRALQETLRCLRLPALLSGSWVQHDAP